MNDIRLFESLANTLYSVGNLVVIRALAEVLDHDSISRAFDHLGVDFFGRLRSDLYGQRFVLARYHTEMLREVNAHSAVTGVLMTSYLGTQVQAVGLDRAYGGLVGRADRLVLVALTATAAAFLRGTLFGLTVVGWLLVFFAVVGHLTALQRFYYALRDLR